MTNLEVENHLFFYIVSFEELPLEKCKFLQFSVEHGKL